jgi:predicted porin
MNKKMLTLAVAAAMAAPTVSHAVKYKLSGQINRAMVAQDDGTSSDIQFIDNSSSGTRWRMKGSEDIGNGQKVGFNWEWQAQSNKAGGPIGSPDTGFAQDLRKAEVWFSGGWGKFSFGQGDGAGNGTTEHDLSDTWNVAYSGRTSFAGSVAWRTGSGDTLDNLAGVSLTHGDTFSAWDAFSRYDRIRYDSPALGPVTLSVSAGAQNKYEGAARWSQGLGGGQISAGLFYGKWNGDGVKNRYGGSVAYLFSFGTNLLVSFGENEQNSPGATKGTTWYFKVGHKWGNNAVSIGYGETEDGSQEVIDDTAAVLALAGLPGDGTGFKDKGFNIGFNHNIPKAKVDLYAGYHFNQLDTPTSVSDVDDIQAFVIGTKLKFD